MIQTPPEITVSSDPASERRLWFDYLSRLTDRQLQTARSTGITNWVVIVTAVGLAYGLINQAAQLAGSSSSLEVFAMIFVLELDLVSFLGFSFVFLYLFTVGSPEVRLLPDLESRQISVILWAVSLLFALITVAHFALAFASAWPSFVKTYLWVMGVVWLLDTTFRFIRLIQRIFHEKISVHPLPRFRGFAWHPNATLLIGAVYLPFGFYACIILLTALRMLSLSSIEWLPPMQAASQLLLFGATMCIMGFRILTSGSRMFLERLEREILLDNLSAEEIKRRFILHSIGPSMADWFKGLAQELKDAAEGVARMRETTLSQIKQIEAIDKSNHHERSKREREYLNELRKTNQEIWSSVKSIQIRFKQILEYKYSLKEDLIKSVAAEYLTQTDRIIKELESIHPLLEEVDHLIDAGTDHA